MPLRLFSLLLLLPVTLANGYWASMLEDNAGYIASLANGRCSAIGGLAVLGAVLPWLFLALGAAAALQLVVQGKFGLSVALLQLHLMHMTLLIGLLILGNGYCNGQGLFGAYPGLSGLVFFCVAVAVIPIPALSLQVDAMRASAGQNGSRP